MTGPRRATDPAMARWLVIQLLRWIGVAMIVLGILLNEGRLAILESGNDLLGYALIVIGLLDGFVAPVFLARRWRSPDR